MGALQGMLGGGEDADYENIEQATFDNIQRMQIIACQMTDVM